MSYTTGGYDAIYLISEIYEMQKGIEKMQWNYTNLNFHRRLDSIRNKKVKIKFASEIRKTFWKKSKEMELKITITCK